MRILLIEDDPLDASDILELLTQDPDATGVIRRVASLAAARDALREMVFDVILVDLSLPDAAGAETIQALLEADDSKPLVVLSGTDNVELAVETVRLGAQDYLVKGQFTTESMSRAIHYAIERKNIERRLHYLAGFDQLTGLVNRQQLCDITRKAAARSGRHAGHGALLFLDLDRFKLVNDRVGHGGGDELLVAVARRLKSVVREEDTVARLGGDEFAIVLPDIHSSADAETVAEKIIAALEVPFNIQDQTCSISTSVGITLYPDDGCAVPTLLRNADLAMYQAKRAGAGNLRFYTPAMNEAVEVRHRVEHRLRTALAGDALSLLYEPVFDLRNGSLSGFQATVFLQDEAGARRPAHELAAETEQLPGLRDAGLWAIRQACHDLRAWAAAGLDLLPVTVNSFNGHWQHDGFGQELKEAVDACGAHTPMLRMSFPESVLQGGITSFAEKAAGLRAHGVALGLTSFTTRHCSLLELPALPVDELTIDPQIVAGMGSDPVVAAVADAILAVAGKAGKRVVAPAIATRESFDIVRKAACPAGMGAYLGDRLTGDQAGGLLEQTRSWNRVAATG